MATSASTTKVTNSATYLTNSRLRTMEARPPRSWPARAIRRGALRQGTFSVDVGFHALILADFSPSPAGGGSARESNVGWAKARFSVDPRGQNRSRAVPLRGQRVGDFAHPTACYVPPPHSITSSALASSVFGTVTPSAFAAYLPSRSESSPLLARGRLYFGSEDGTVYALEAGSGHTVWTYHAAGAVKASPRACRRGALLRRLLRARAGDQRAHRAAGGWRAPKGRCLAAAPSTRPPPSCTAACSSATPTGA